MYAILITGYGKRRRYSIHKISGSGTVPTDGISYRTEELALEACKARGYDVIATGDIYQILHAASTEEEKAK